jgi:hypothetical protein
MFAKHVWSAIAIGWLLCAATLVEAQEPARRLPAPLIIESEGSFFIGGHERSADNLNGGNAQSPATNSGKITTGQMYVQYQIPAGATHLPVVMIHGGYLTGQVYETTPDGRMGWNQYFVRSHRPVYNVDQVGRGRSGFNSSIYNAVKLGKKKPSEQPPMLTISRDFSWIWFRIGPAPHETFPDTQFPVAAVNEFYKTLVPDLNLALSKDNPTYSDLAVLSERLGGAILMGHSEAFMFPERAALLNPASVKGIISLESSNACATSFSQSEYAVLARIPILIVFADHLSDSARSTRARWTTSIMQCQKLADTVRKEGGDVTFLSLPNIGIHGNTHMFMLDKNNLDIADIILSWIDEHVEHEIH